MKRIAICGGHLTPALGLIEQFRNSKNVEILFFGRKYATEGSLSLSAEYKMVTEKGIKFYPISSGRLQRRFSKFTLFSILKLPVGFLQSIYYLILTRPKLIVSFGGYLSTPIVFCGWLLGIESITHEQASIPGLATKINSLFCKKIFLTWKESAKFFKTKKVEVIGNLLRSSLFTAEASSHKIAAFLKSRNNMVLITGGNQGSHFLNNFVFENLELFKKFDVFHQVGTANWQNDLLRAKRIRSENYIYFDYINPEDFGAVLNKAIIVISRAGANTVWDLATLRKPAILIPLPFSSGGEQQANARILETAGMARVIQQQNLSARMLKAELNSVIKNLNQYQKNAASFEKNLPKHASQIITAFIFANTQS